VHELEQAYRARLDAWPRGRAVPAALREVPWMIEELRVSQFAQGLGTNGPVSAKRIRRALAEAA
jgi:ATP-dependent RNA helicase HrpA